ncbi:Putative serine/threonine-protein kinase [Picochlorum sp. SENEW3]|nr:Putative serine/threonine-protein kinase [Picochlorum sp. SENEW3]WPT14793.1 Putative serine/threonine-protein kinase [Picochlorum sp. SENEW3]
MMKKGTVLDKHFVLSEKIGQGQFAEVYAASNVKNQRQIQVAVKVDKSRDVKILGREAAILKDLQCSEFVCKFIASGKVKDGRRYCVMELLGDNLSKYMKSKQLELTEIISIAKQILMGIRDIHSAGYVHRDIKPSNCAIRVGGRCMAQWTLLDFGLARKVIGNDGRQMPERKDTSFRGTTGYASINAHDQRDLSWRDDLWSWFYTVVELLQGTLPWKGHRHDESFNAADGPVAQRKRACIKAPELLVPSTAAYFSQIEDINHYLSKLEFDEVPDYLLLRDLLESMEHQQMEANVESESKYQQGYQLQTVSVPRGLETAVQNDNAPKEEENCTFKQEVNVEDVSKGSAAYEEKCYDNINQLVSILKMGGYSRKGQMVIDTLRDVTPGEAIAIFCDHMNRISIGNPNSADVVEIMKELSGYFAALSRSYQKMS